MSRKFNDHGREKLKVVMKERKLSNLIKRCQEKDRLGWEYVHPIQKKTDIINVPRYKSVSDKRIATRNGYMTITETYYFVTMTYNRRRNHDNEVNNREINREKANV